VGVRLLTRSHDLPFDLSLNEAPLYSAINLFRMLEHRASFACCLRSIHTSLLSLSLSNPMDQPDPEPSVSSETSTTPSDSSASREESVHDEPHTSAPESEVPVAAGSGGDGAPSDQHDEQQQQQQAPPQSEEAHAASVVKLETTLAEIQTLSKKIEMLHKRLNVRPRSRRACSLSLSLSLARSDEYDDDDDDLYPT